MTLNDLPVGLVFVGTTALVVGAIECGYRIGGRSHRQSEAEKESPVSAIAATVLALLAFILAFNFGIVANRYDARKALVRDEANIIRTVFARTDFLPSGDREESRRLINEYVDILLEADRTKSLDDIPAMVVESQGVHDQIWAIAVKNVDAGWNSDIDALYISSLNDMSAIQATRVAVSLQSNMPNGLWLVLFILLALGMMAVGYQTAIAASRRSWSMLILALSFSIVISLIAALDNPKSGFLDVSHQPLIDLQQWMQRTPSS